MTEFILKSQAGREVFAFENETRAREMLAKSAKQGIRLRLFKMVRTEEELPA